jgi:hypothetical protein
VPKPATLPGAQWVRGFPAPSVTFRVEPPQLPSVVARSEIAAEDVVERVRLLGHVWSSRPAKSARVHRHPGSCNLTRPGTRPGSGRRMLPRAQPASVIFRLGMPVRCYGHNNPEGERNNAADPCSLRQGVRPPLLTELALGNEPKDYCGR